MQADALTKMERSGSNVAISNPTSAERDKLWLHLSALRGAGHAITADENNHGDGSVTLTVTHYLSCRKCNGD